MDTFGERCGWILRRNSEQRTGNHHVKPKIPGCSEVISLVSSAPDSTQLREFRQWIEAEWGAVNSFESKDGRLLPAPILALDDGVLVGGLSFIHFPAPGTEQLAPWINAVLVAPEFRRRKIGSRLVQAAEKSAVRMGIQELYVYTRTPHLYQNLGWCICCEPHGEDIVLRKSCLE